VSCIDSPDFAHVNWERLLNSITPQEKMKVQRFRNVKDQRHAMTSILLQRALIRSAFLVSDRDYQILRTSEVKF
jgi:phosphopantetheinyl transferase